MKKCYIIPDVKVTSVEIASMVCTSPGQSIDTGSFDAPSDDTPVAGDDEEFGARQRGGDFGSLW